MCYKYPKFNISDTFKTKFSGPYDSTTTYFKLKATAFIDISNDNMMHIQFQFVCDDEEYTLIHQFLLQEKKSKAFRNIYEYNEYLSRKIDHMNAMLCMNEFPFNDFICIESYNGDDYYQLYFSFEKDENKEIEKPLSVSISYADVNSDRIS